MKWSRAVEVTAAALLAGFFSRSWALAALLAVAVGGSLLLVGALHPCVAGPGEECDVNSGTLVLFYFLPATFVIIGVGVLLRHLVALTVGRLRSRTTT
jgi:hypothetical protein